MITMGIKKACGNEAIGDNVRPDGLITIFFISVGKGTENIWNRQEKREEICGELEKSRKKML